MAWTYLRDRTQYGGKKNPIVHSETRRKIACIGQCTNQFDLKIIKCKMGILEEARSNNFIIYTHGYEDVLSRCSTQKWRQRTPYLKTVKCNLKPYLYTINLLKPILIIIG